MSTDFFFLKNSVPKLFFPWVQGGSGVAPFQKTASNAAGGQSNCV